MGDEVFVYLLLAEGIERSMEKDPSASQISYS